MRLPEGFAARATAPGLVLVCRADGMDAALAAGLGTIEAWEQTLTPQPAAGAGRGATGRIELGGARLYLKKLRRGGMLRALWRDRFLGTGRIVANVVAAHEAMRRGVATAAPVAALIRDRGLGFREGWLAVEEIAGASSLHARLSSGSCAEDEIRAALGAARELHDRGIMHRDLNLGNLLIRPAGAHWEGFVIDLDRARIGDPPVALRARRAALERLERSYEKWFGADECVAAAWYRLYAEGRADLAALVTRPKGFGRVRLSFHRLGWRLARARSAGAPRRSR